MLLHLQDVYWSTEYLNNMKDPVWKLLTGYILVLFFILLSTTAFGQINVTQYNAAWNDANKVTWLKKLSDVDKVGYVDIAANPEIQKKREIVVVPTIIIFKDGEEVKRFQADISFTMKATREEIQDFIDELLMEDF
jgi:thiol-disulfide isomerase/thioredoxin